MKKTLLSFLCSILCCFSLYGQFDTEHWFAPYYDSSSSSYVHGLYLSTDQITPFEVRIHNNNTVVGTVMISKGNPQVFTVPIALIRANTTADAGAIRSKGLYVEGDNKFYATLRMSVSSHGEIVTSKGKAGIGNKFFATVAPLTYSSSSMNFTTSFLATEDNTTVTVSGYNTGVRFVNMTGNPQSVTVTLDKGQSYILAGIASTAAANMTGFIGARIESNKPISVTNGNANGMYATSNTTSGSDLILDQSVPTERLGNEFAIIRSISPFPSHNNEGAIVVATEDNTQIFVNDALTPTATINAGQFYRILENGYINQGNNHYNMYVKATKNVYLYQLVGAGTTSGSNTNTGGFNYIPPLNCFLPRKIDEIGKINEINNVTSAINIKLNVLTEAGANVLINGVAPTPAQGPYPLRGNNLWVTYAVPNIAGNITVTSTKAVTMGVNGGYSTAGYGGYFAGFSSVPAISKKVGECLPGVVLEVDDHYETYQWAINGVAIPGATANTYTPTQVGYYTVTVTMGTCDPVTTPPLKVTTCTVETPIDVTICRETTFPLEFANSHQTPVPSTAIIITAPVNGTASIHPLTGAVTYTPNAGYAGPDSLVYQFCGNNTEFTDCEKVTLNFEVVPLAVRNAKISACAYEGQGFFDLTTADVTDFVPVVSEYFPTLSDAQNGTNQIINVTAYLSQPRNVYVKVTTPEGCSEIAEIELVLNFDGVPVQDVIIKSCALDNNQNLAEFDLTNAPISGIGGVTKEYYPSDTDAFYQTNAIPNPTNYIAPNGVVYVRVTGGGFDCFSIARVELVVLPPLYSTVLKDKQICIDSVTSLDAGPGFDAYEWSTGDLTQSIDNVGVGTYWVNLISRDGCTFKQEVKVYPVASPVISGIEITQNSISLDVIGGSQPYMYSLDNINWQNSPKFENVSRGEYTVYVKDSFNCTPIIIPVTLPNIINTITPNGDGINDVLDYSALANKNNLVFSIYDRYGVKIFEGNKDNNYQWDGKIAGKNLSTGTYWYSISWNEGTNNKIQMQYSSWLMIKNR